MVDYTQRIGWRGHFARPHGMVDCVGEMLRITFEILVRVDDVMSTIRYGLNKKLDFNSCPQPL